MKNTITPAERMSRLRKTMTQMGIDGFVLPLTDAYQNEYVPAAYQRLAWLTGFTGSAGLAIILANRAAFFTDGRYTVQVRQEVDGTLFDLCALDEGTITDWLYSHLPGGQTLGLDPWLHTKAQVRFYRQLAWDYGWQLRFLDHNPIDTIWTDRPEVGQAPLMVHDHTYAGVASRDKRMQVANMLKSHNVCAGIVAAPDALAWLTNLRGSDVDNATIFLGYGVLHTDGRLAMFLDPAASKFSAQAQKHVGEDVVAYDVDALQSYIAQHFGPGDRVGIDNRGAPYRVRRFLKQRGVQPVPTGELCDLPKACKNATEQEGMRACHIRDGAYLTQFLHWLSVERAWDGVDELAACDKLVDLRSQDPLYRGNSFPTVSASGPHGALPHYRVVAHSNRALYPGELYLVDSGGHYLDGTTDVTRTVFVGNDQPTATQRLHYTLVLKGYIQLATTRFPAGTSGAQLDALARRPLWEHGLDYAHGTGHGVGSFLNVHEGPQRIAKRGSTTALRPGMVLSIEPGYYREDMHGIRIENLVMVQEAEDNDAYAERMLQFATLTWAPLDTRLIDRNRLTPWEEDWVDTYHRGVHDRLSPLLPQHMQDWLACVTAPLAESAGGCNGGNAASSAEHSHWDEDDEDPTAGAHASTYGDSVYGYDDADWSGRRVASEIDE